jgi:hypothetical protein
MGQDAKSNGREFAEFLRGIAPERMVEHNKQQLEGAEREHAEFAAAFKQAQCYLCGADLTSFFAILRCLHWMLRPAGFKKEHFPAVASAFGYRSLSCYLRWVANEDGKARGINDLREEGSGKLIEETIRYRQFEWAFSCGQNDYDGHNTGNPLSEAPHYHFQMRINLRPFIRYNDFHVPFTEEDLVTLEAMRAAPDLIKRVNVGSEGMHDLLHDVPLEALIAHGRSSDTEAASVLSLSTMVLAPEGETISGEALYEAFAEAKREGVTVTSILHKKLPTANIRTMISPGEGVVEQAVRSGRGKAKT